MQHDDFKFEPIRGLPEALPRDEVILWQGRPMARRLAVEAFKVRWIMGYFVALAAWRAIVSTAEVPLGTALLYGSPFVLLGLIVCAILYGLAWIQSRATVYTLTNKRVAMRIGAALTMTLNLPYVEIESADLDLRPAGSGTLAFQLPADTRLSYLMSWPHIRPGRINRTQPALRCIADAAKVADIFTDAARTRISQPTITRATADLSAMAAE
ncbi:photosynthetic complex putative assembly protein PuhB [Loktanella sp. SALINAS62]|uniref:photosynthetic complex putative assembly protein PuhB n=1 Tax=Loktanella sp. SALINAS62 TaxID=2706124 RepID=UPI001B8AC341|nr:photosynthetic complex putative assembly protein PuhB [Loktanella sp. SALINAS62]MBS1302288.1 PH domain-containing protein [Loktanella sp. SALINAS62]